MNSWLNIMVMLFPITTIAQNVLASMGVPFARTEDVLSLIVEGAEELGLIAAIKDKKFVQLAGGIMPSEAADAKDDEEATEDKEANTASPISQMVSANNNKSDNRATTTPQNDKVFITHGKNISFVEPIKKLLKYGKLQAVVSVERQTASKAVPDKVMDDMRSCGAAIIHVDAETQLTDTSGTQHTILNPNVLIEIGAAMALYGKKFILLVREGVTLPSNLQGLYQVRYKGDGLSADEAMNLLEAINTLNN